MKSSSDSIRLLIVFFALNACGIPAQKSSLITGADQLDLIATELSGKKTGLLANNTSLVKNAHLADTLKSLGVNLTVIFSPEHGFRGAVQAGEKINDEIDAKTGLPVVSLYGDSRKPTAAQLTSVDVVLFDIQDVGARFYTYISSLHYLMEACAENGKQIIVLDRPNPNGNFIDGPVLKKEFRSFVGMHPIPIAHGLTVGELAMMINGEGWLEAGRKCDLKVITMKNWKHDDSYSVPVKPSPNLPNDHAIALYPSTCLFEGTALSVGRGTLNPFEFIGHPDLKNQPFEFIPVSIEGMATNPRWEGKTCYGLDLRNVKAEKKIMLKYIISMYEQFPDKEKFFKSYFNTLAGNAELKEQIKQGMSEEQIMETWQKDLVAYKAIREKYLLYQ